MLIILIWFLPLVIHILMKGALKQGMEKCSGESLKELNLESHYPDEKVAFRKSSKIASSSVAFEKEPKVRGKRKIQLQGRQNQVSCTTNKKRSNGNKNIREQKFFQIEQKR